MGTFLNKILYKIILKWNVSNTVCPSAIKKVKQSRYRPGVAQRVSGS